MTSAQTMMSTEESTIFEKRNVASWMRLQKLLLVASAAFHWAEPFRVWKK